MKVDHYKLLILRKAGFTQKQTGEVLGCTQTHVSTIEKKYRNNGIPEKEKVIIDSAAVYGPEKAFEFLELSRLVARFAKERDEREKEDGS